MIKLISLAVGLVAFPWICYHCVTADGPAIQLTLQRLVSEAETTAAIPGVQVDADGREITLTGTVPTEETRARAGVVAAVLPGVRTVDNRLTVVPPPPTAAVVQEQLNQILLDKRIEFETARDVLLPTSLPILEDVARVLKQAPQLAVTIAGHTDDRGDAEMNRALSDARARAVLGWLTEHGIEQSRLQSAGYGPERPIAPNTTAEGRAKNRRVDITAR